MAADPPPGPVRKPSRRATMRGVPVRPSMEAIPYVPREAPSAFTAEGLAAIVSRRSPTEGVARASRFGRPRRVSRAGGAASGAVAPRRRTPIVAAAMAPRSKSAICDLLGRVAGRTICWLRLPKQLRLPAPHSTCRVLTGPRLGGSFTRNQDSQATHDAEGVWNVPPPGRVFRRCPASEDAPERLSLAWNSSEAMSRRRPAHLTEVFPKSHRNTR